MLNVQDNLLIEVFFSYLRQNANTKIWRQLQSEAITKYSKSKANAIEDVDKMNDFFVVAALAECSVKNFARWPTT